MALYDAKAVANKILQFSEKLGINLTPMQLIKLVYFANGWFMANSGHIPLTKDKAEAWQFGPVYRSVYDAFKKYRNKPIALPAFDPSTGAPYGADIKMSRDALIIIETVVREYGKLHAFELSDITHKEGTPWHSTFHSQGVNSEIDNELIAEHYSGLRRKQ